MTARLLRRPTTTAAAEVVTLDPPIDALLETLRAVAPTEAVIFTSFHQSPLPLALVLRMAGVGRIAGISGIAQLALLENEPESSREALDTVVKSAQNGGSITRGLLTFAPGRMVAVPELRFRLVQLGTFSPAENSAVPHNALHDARALRDHVLGLE